MKKFSVIIPVYNVKEYLEECLKSVLNQTYQDFEIIIVDDGSNDGSEYICDKYNGENIKVLHKKNEGPLLARIDAINLATGEFCIFLDSDDTLELNCLEVINSLLINYNDLDMIIYNLFIWDSYNNRKVIRKPLFHEKKFFDAQNKPDLYEIIINSTLLNNLWIKAIKTDILKKDITDYSKFNSFIMEDLLQTLYPITVSKKILYIPTPLYNYRINQNSITRKNVTLEQIKYKFNNEGIVMLLNYLKIWHMDTEYNIEKIYTRQLKPLVQLFNKYFLSCNSRMKRIECVNFNWFGIILPESNNFINSKMIKWKYRIQLKWIKDKKYYRLCFIRIFLKIKNFLKKEYI